MLRRGTETSRPSWWWPFVALVLPVWSIFIRYRFSGHKLPREGAFILAPNHYSEIDPVAIAVGVWRLGRVPRFLAKEGIFKAPVAGWAMRKMRHIPVTRSSTGAAVALAAGKALAEDGGCLVVYPEGTLTRDPDMWPMRGKTGAVRIALETGIPLIPCAHWGVQKILPRYGKRISLLPPKTVEMAFGEPMDLSKYQGRPIDAALLAEATDELMDQIAALLVTLRGGQPPAERWDPSKHGQAETGRF